MSLALLFGLVAVPAGANPGIRVDAGNVVPSCMLPDRLMSFLRQRNPALDRRFENIAEHYRREGQALGIRWDYAFFQMIVETGGLTFRRCNGRPGAVSPRQNNFAGLGATGGREPGESFPDVATGVRAHLQHVVLYTGARVQAPVAERTRKVQDWGIISAWQRGLGRSTTFPDLARLWAPDSRGYWGHIEAVAIRYREQHCLAPEPEPAIADAGRRAPAAVAEDQSAFALARQALAAATAPKPPPRSGLGAGMIDPRPEPMPAAEPPAPPAAARQPAFRQAAAGLPMAPARPPAPAPQPAAVTPPPSPAALEPAPARPMTREERENEKLRQMISGRTVLLDTPIGTVIPIEFSDDGRMRGKAGGLAGFLGAAQDEGQWWVEKAKLCQRWNVWFKREQQCLKFKQSGQIIHWESDTGRSGTAKLVGQPDRAAVTREPETR